VGPLNMLFAVHLDDETELNLVLFPRGSWWLTPSAYLCVRDPIFVDNFFQTKGIQGPWI
jgi:hypothetical protein